MSPRKLSALPAKSEGAVPALRKQNAIDLKQKKLTPNTAIKAVNVGLASIVAALAVFVGAVVTASIFAPEKLDAVATKLPNVLQDIVFWIVAHGPILGALSITLLVVLYTNAKVAIDYAVYDAKHR